MIGAGADVNTCGNIVHVGEGDSLRRGIVECAVTGEKDRL